MTTHRKITDYCLAPIEQVPQRLAEGFQPYGPLVICSDHQRPEPSIFYQVLIKSEVIEFSVNQLSEIEQACIEGLMSGLKYNDIAVQIKRSRSRVRDIVAKLRERYDCDTNTSLVARFSNK